MTYDIIEIGNQDIRVIERPLWLGGSTFFEGLPCTSPP